MTKIRNTIMLFVFLATLIGYGLQARAQSWVETVFVDGKICTITYVNGGRQSYINCI